MKKLQILVFVFMVSAGLMLSQVVHVTSPAAGASYNKGDIVNIIWTSPNCQSGDVKINIFKNSTDPANFVEQLTGPNTGSKQWTIPQSYTDGNYILRVKTDPAETGCLGDSGVFTIGSIVPQGSITVSTPSNIITGNDCMINWTSTGTVGSAVHVLLFNQAGNAQVYLIAHNTNNDGSHTWPVSGSFQTGDYRIKVQNLDGSISGISGVFKISNFITTLRPSEGHVYFAPTPDLKITIIPVTGPTAEVNKETLMQFKVDNIGNGTSQETTLKVYMGQKNTDTWVIKSIEPGRFRYKTKNFTPTTAGGYIAWAAKVDEENKIGDSKRDNNYAKYKMIVNGPDLVVAFDGNIRSIITTTARVKGYIKNIGHTKSEPCKLKIYMEKKGNSQHNIPALNPGQVFEVSRGEKYYIAQHITVKMTIDSEGKVNEENEGNNYIKDSINIVLSGPYWATNYVCSTGKTGPNLNDVW